MTSVVHIDRRSRGRVGHGLGGAVLLAMLAIVLPTQASSEQAGVIDSGRFRIRPPPGGAWEVTKEPDRVFLRQDRHSEGQLIETTAILVLRTRPVDEKCGLSEAETAANYCRDEAFDLWLSGQVTGLFGLEDLRREEVFIAGRKLYAMHYHQEFAEEFGGARTDNMMYMYFPESFGRDNYFYVFLQTEACMRGSCPERPYDMDETPVRSIIVSLETHTVPGRE
jgi:hypothetical protein